MVRKSHVECELELQISSSHQRKLPDYPWRCKVRSESARKSRQSWCCFSIIGLNLIFWSHTDTKKYKVKSGHCLLRLHRWHWHLREVRLWGHFQAVKYMFLLWFFTIVLLVWLIFLFSRRCTWSVHVNQNTLYQKHSCQTFRHHYVRKGWVLG